MVGFEPTTPYSQSKCDNRTSLHLEDEKNFWTGLEFFFLIDIHTYILFNIT